jgi:hypothetical protein
MSELKRLERKRSVAESKGDVKAEHSLLKDIARFHSVHDDPKSAIKALKRALALGG